MGLIGNTKDPIILFSVCISGSYGFMISEALLFSMQSPGTGSWGSLVLAFEPRGARFHMALIN